jgi:CubicO group peptidase (beta-lactamase class C family)
VWAGIGTLWENRQLTLDDPLAALMPGLADYPLGPVTVRQLLTHTAGVPDRPSSTPTGLPSSWDSSSSTAPVPGSTRWHASTSGNLSA